MIDELFFTEDDDFGKAEEASRDDDQVVDMSMLRPIHDDIELNKMIELYKTSDDENEKNIIANSIITYFAGRVKRSAGKFSKQISHLYDDLVQSGNEVISNYISRYDPERGASFSTFVYQRVEADIKRFYRRNANQIAIPVNKQCDHYRIEEIISDYYKDFGEEPSDEYIADKIGSTARAVRDIVRSFPVETSLDRTIDEKEELTVIDNVADDAVFSEPNRRKMFKAMLESLDNEDEKKVFLLGIGCDENGEQINEALGSNVSAYVRALGCSRSHAQKLLNNTQNHLRNVYGAYAA